MNIKKYKLKSMKITKDVKFVSFGDMHISTKINNELYYNLLKTIDKEKPEFVVCTGDILDYSNDCDERISRFFYEVTSFTKKIIITLGNHDIISTDKKTYINNDFIKELKNISNVELLQNENYYDKENNINFIGLNPLDASFYLTLCESYCRYRINVDNVFPKNFDHNMFNIFIDHSPINCMTKKALEEINALKEIDLILSGHMHNGAVPDWANMFLSIFNKNIGLISPQRKFKEEVFKTKLSGLIQVADVLLPNSENLEKILKNLKEIDRKNLESMRLNLMNHHKLFPKNARGLVNLGETKGIINSCVTFTRDNSMKGKILNSKLGISPSISSVKILCKK